MRIRVQLTAVLDSFAFKSLLKPLTVRCVVRAVRCAVNKCASVWSCVCCCCAERQEHQNACMCVCVHSTKNKGIKRIFKKNSQRKFTEKKATKNRATHNNKYISYIIGKPKRTLTHTFTRTRAIE